MQSPRQSIDEITNAQPDLLGAQIGAVELAETHITIAELKRGMIGEIIGDTSHYGPGKIILHDVIGVVPMLYAILIDRLRIEDGLRALCRRRAIENRGKAGRERQIRGIRAAIRIVDLADGGVLRDPGSADAGADERRHAIPRPEIDIAVQKQGIFAQLAL